MFTKFIFTPAVLAAILGAILSLFFSYFPKVRDWFAAHYAGGPDRDRPGALWLELRGLDRGGGLDLRSGRGGGAGQCLGGGDRG
jgi:hypothetical protein